MTWLMFAGGLTLLVIGAGLLVRCASSIGRMLRISPLVIGLTIVAFGTSAPELAVSINAAAIGQSDVALGNVVGSNIFNVLFILGITALIKPLIVDRKLVRQEVPWLILVSVLTVILAIDGVIGFLDGLLLVSLLVTFSFLQLRQARSEPVAELVSRSKDSNIVLQIGGVLAGLALLVLGSEFLVASAIQIARDLGISDVTIALTIIAAGTSLPEVATSVVAALRGEREIAVGNVLGSNLFNLMAVAGIAALISPDGLMVAPSVNAFDLPVMAIVAIACLPVFFTGGRIDRWEGALFLFYYAAYATYLVLYTEQHDLLDDFQKTMTFVVGPLTILTAAAMYVGSRRRSHN